MWALLLRMNLTTEQRRNGILVRISGDIDTLTAPALQNHLNEQVRDEAQLFVIDLSSVRYISSMGLRVFLSHLKRVKAFNGRMAIAGPSKLVSEVFHISGFSSYFEIVERLDDIQMDLD